MHQNRTKSPISLVKNKQPKIQLIIICSLILLFSAGCSQKYYYNKGYPDNMQQQLLNRDMAYCNALSSGAVPPQQLVVNTPPPNSTTYGNFQSNSYGTQYSGTYSSQTTYDTTAYQMANMANSMTMLASSIRRENIYNQCIAGQGWIQTNGKDLTADERILFGLPPATNATQDYYYSSNYPENLQQKHFNQDSNKCINQNSETKLKDNYLRCMNENGWHQTKGRELTPEERNFFGLPPVIERPQ